MYRILTHTRPVTAGRPEEKNESSHHGIITVMRITRKRAQKHALGKQITKNSRLQNPLIHFLWKMWRHIKPKLEEKLQQKTFAPCRIVSVMTWYGRFSEILTFCCMTKFLRQKTHSKNKNCYKEVTLYLMDSPWKIFWEKKKIKNFNLLFTKPKSGLADLWRLMEAKLRTITNKTFWRCILTTLITI